MCAIRCLGLVPLEKYGSMSHAWACLGLLRSGRGSNEAGRTELGNKHDA